MSLGGATGEGGGGGGWWGGRRGVRVVGGGGETEVDASKIFPLRAKCLHRCPTFQGCANIVGISSPPHTDVPGIPGVILCFTYLVFVENTEIG